MYVLLFACNMRKKVFVCVIGEAVVGAHVAEVVNAGKFRRRATNINIDFMDKDDFFSSMFTIWIKAFLNFYLNLNIDGFRRL